MPMPLAALLAHAAEERERDLAPHVRSASAALAGIINAAILRVDINKTIQLTVARNRRDGARMDGELPNAK